MEATITRLEDIFKTKVKDSIKVPTIWFCPETGQEYKDYKHPHIESRDPARPDWHAAWMDPSYVDKKNPKGLDILIINGYIKQIGSHVISCGKLADSVAEYPCLDHLEDVFKYAYNLEYVHKALSCETFIHQDFKIPENLFWNCPKLKGITQFFGVTQVQIVPSGLFAKCPDLESVEEVFYSTNVREIPEDLFKNNPKITNFEGAFNHTEIEKIPDHLFDSVKKGLLIGDVNVGGFAEFTRVDDKFSKEKAPKTTEEREIKRNTYLPKDLPRDIQWRLINRYDYYPPEDF